MISAAGTQWSFIHQSMIYHAAELLSFLTKFVGGAIHFPLFQSVGAMMGI
jgi:hypothetical protein